jgi:WD40 repeat protein
MGRKDRRNDYVLKWQLLWRTIINFKTRLQTIAQPIRNNKECQGNPRMIKSGRWNFTYNLIFFSMNLFASTRYKFVGELKGHTDSVQSLALTKDGQTLASGGKKLRIIY